MVSLSVLKLLNEFSSRLKSKTFSQYIAKKTEYLKKTKPDPATIIEKTTNKLENNWKDISLRMKIIPGKIVLKNLRTIVKERYKVDLSNSRLISNYSKSSIPNDIKELIINLEKFRTQ